MRICPDCAANYAADERFCHADGAVLLAVGDDPLIGLTVGSYKLVRMLGEGGMGQVYLGVHPGIGSRVAIKLLDPSAASRQDLVERFFAEAMAVNRIRHENIVNVLDLDKLELPGGITRPYIIMENLEGRPLDAVLSHFGRLPQGTLTQLAREILGALAAAHQAGIVHRDLKPDNVFVSPQGRAKVLDFGIAKLLPNAGLGQDARFTQTGMLLGTPSYMAPEQARGQTVTPATDIYALGVILFEAATGSLPFAGETLYDLLNAHVTLPPPPPRSIEPSIHPALEGVILHALAKRPEERFHSAGQMASALLDASAMFPSESWASISLTGDEPALIATPTPRPTPSAGAPWRPDPAQTPPVPQAKRPSTGTRVAIGLGIFALIGAAVAAAVVVPRLGGEDNTSAVALNETDAAPAVASLEDAASAAQGEATDPISPTDLAPGGPTVADSKGKAKKDAANNNAANEANRKEGAVKEGAKNSPDKEKPDKEKPDKEKPDKEKPDEEEPAKKGGVILIETSKEAEKKGYKPFTVAAGVNTKQFDAVAFVPSAQKLARRLMSDAKLTEFEVAGATAGGKTNLHKRYGSASYWFRSPSRSKRDPTLPKGAEGEDIACMVYVDVNNGEVEVYATTREKCNDSFRRRPRCSVAQVWKKALALGAPTGNWVAKLTYDRGWFFNIDDAKGDGNDFVESIPDDC